MTTFHFLFHDGTEIVFSAATCKHYTGHAALEDATIIKNSKNYVPVGTHFSRFNIALNGDLFGMYPEEEPKEFIANCTGFCYKHTATLTTSGHCPKCDEDELPF